MLYPRIGTVDGKECLVKETECVTYREHLADKHRTIFLTGVIDGAMDNHNLLLALDTLSDEPIKVVITSPGGDLDSALLLYDTFKLMKSPIYTIGRFCASAACLLLVAGVKRFLYPHAKVMLHLPSGVMGGDAKDWEIQLVQMQQNKARIVDILRENGVKKATEEILGDIDRDFWLTANEAIDYGLADTMLTKEIWAEWTKEGNNGRGWRKV